MAKLRKMLGDIHSPECIALMRLIETQSQMTLSTWAIQYVKENYLNIYVQEYPNDYRLHNLIHACEDYLEGNISLKDIKLIIKESRQIVKDVLENPIAQAAMRAITTACATIITPTNALGFVFYGTAAVAYHQIGLLGNDETYYHIAKIELQKILDSLQKVSISDEEQPVKIKWHC